MQHWFRKSSLNALAVYSVLQFACMAVSAQTALQAASGLLKRVLPGHWQEVELAVQTSVAARDQFTVDRHQGHLRIRGNNAVAIASGLYYYLNQYCHAQITDAGVQLKLPRKLPVPSVAVTKETPYQYRYYLNYCTFNYSMAWWSWPQWEQRIDWMALHGINMPLAITGESYTWYLLYKELGFTDDELRDFFPGPAYFAWFYMGNLDAWGGPLPLSWMKSHLQLAKKILARERALGMKPVLPAFTGHVPSSFQKHFPRAKLKAANWHNGFGDTYILDPGDPAFAEIGRRFLQKQDSLLGTDHLYSADTFNENEPPSSEPAYLKSLSSAVYSAMQAADSTAVWVMQGWLFYSDRRFWQPQQTEALLSGVADKDMILLDLAAEIEPVWKRTQAFYGKPWIWNMVNNFGGNTNLFGRLDVVATAPADAWRSLDHGKLCGIGLTMEGTGANPVIYELMMDHTWRDSAINLDQWLPAYVRNRYGTESQQADSAWRILRRTVYFVPPDRYIRDGAESIAQARPCFDSSTRWTNTKLNYRPGDLLPAWDLLMEAIPACGSSDGFRFDLVDITRQVLANYALPIQQRAARDYRSNDLSALSRDSLDFLTLIQDMDRLLSTRQEFLLGSWLDDARKWGTSAEEKNRYEKNARDLITLWGDENCPLHEYACRQWSGLLSGFYAPRWAQFFSAVLDSLRAGRPWQQDDFDQRIRRWEWNWVCDHQTYPSLPAGDPVAIAKELYNKYRNRIADAYQIRQSIK